MSTDLELTGNFAIAATLSGESRDLKLLRHHLMQCRGVTLAHGLSRELVGIAQMRWV